MKIILGSSSLQRQNILLELGYEFEIVKPDVDEKSIRRENPRDLVLALANAKADNVVNKIKEEAVVIAADSIVLVNNEVREKPESKDEAYKFLQDLSRGVPQTVVTALVAVNTQTRERREGVAEGTVVFNAIPDEDMREFVESGQALNHAAAFAIQHPIFLKRIKEVKGEFETIVGLPKSLVQNILFLWLKN